MVELTELLKQFPVSVQEHFNAEEPIKTAMKMAIAEANTNKPNNILPDNIGEALFEIARRGNDSDNERTHLTSTNEYQSMLLLDEDIIGIRYKMRALEELYIKAKNNNDNARVELTTTICTEKLIKLLEKSGKVFENPLTNSDFIRSIANKINIPDILHNKNSLLFKALSQPVTQRGLLHRSIRVNANTYITKFSNDIRKSSGNNAKLLPQYRTKTN